MNTIDNTINPMTQEQFWAAFDECKTDMERIGCMLLAKKDNYPYDKETQPDAMLQRFCSCACDGPIFEGIHIEDITCSRTVPSIVADAFTKCFGQEIICEEATRCRNKKQTIIDCLDTMGDANPHTVRELIVAFAKLGHKRA